MSKRLLRLYKYNIFIILGLAGVVLLFVVKYQSLPQVQFSIVLALVVFYLAWALIYHFLDKSLSLEVMLEYILTALLALVVVYGALL